MEEPEQDSVASPGSSCDNDKDTFPDEQRNAQKGKNANSWQRKNEKLKKKIESEKRELQEEINSLKSQQKSIKCENGNLRSRLQEAEIIKKSLQEQVQVLNRNNQSLTEQKDDLILRLSKLAGAKLTVDNPNIADLSDCKRPTKLAEEFAELYDNEWTDAFENIQLESEPEKIEFMLRLLQSTRHICNDVSRRHMEDITKGIVTLTVRTKKSSEKLSSEQNAIESCNKNDKAESECNESEDKRKRLKVDAVDSDTLEEFVVIEPGEHGEVMNCEEPSKEISAHTGSQTPKVIEPGEHGEVMNCEEPSKEISAHAGSHTPKVHIIAGDVNTFSAAQKQAILEIKKDVEVRLSKQLQEVVTNMVAIENNIDRQTQDSTIKYIAKCVDICWSMCQHEPPVFFDLPETNGETCLDVNVYKPYTKSGKYIDYIVWPPLYLYMGGPLLGKGVAQGRS
ncbi:cilium assembly protein DZIP1L-like isoform X1 [Ruditapes philippinarum]|uniref:cilium assembly protein DZIP1L-like isoform X1 n=1 Tax=Ruditapes philippinarum TaxID=129788 RepID=UPI00295A8210|nr:cilium assembly protein DZIP1L-like isoform X1 [Ruditapes philippinarum]